jgi:hypothetical protein
MEKKIPRMSREFRISTLSMEIQNPILSQITLLPAVSLL